MGKMFFPSQKATFVNEGKIISGFRKIASKIARDNKNVEEIYLFGSYAKGNAGLHSDADILIVLAKDQRSPLDRLDEFILRFSDGPVPADVLAYTRAELNSALEKGNRFLVRAMDGVKLI